MFFLKELPSNDMVERYATIIPDGDLQSINQALCMMRDVSVLVRSLESYFKKHHLSQLRFLVLMVIDREINRSSLFAHEIAARLDVSRPVLARAVKTLIRDGLLQEKVEVTDKRAKQLSLTNQGTKLLVKILPDYFKRLYQFVVVKEDIDK